ncbi:MAG: hypothetical protein WCK15_21950, partial [Pirellula sp.]
LPGNSMQARLRLAEMHPYSGGRSLHAHAFPGRACERVVSCETLIPISGPSPTDFTSNRKEKLILLTSTYL